MAARVHSTMDQLCGMQQGLEASMMNHRQELLHRFGEKLEHACQQAEDSAFHRAREYIVPAVEVLADQLNAHKEAARSDSESLHGAVAALAARLESVCDDASQLRARSEHTLGRLEELGGQLSSEAQARTVRCDELHGQISEVRTAAADECQRRAAAEADLSGRLREAAEEAAAAVRASIERADEQFRQVHQRGAAAEERLAQALQQDVAQCLREARQHADALAAQLQQQLQDAALHAERSVAASKARTEGLLGAAVDELHERHAGASRDLAGAQGALRLEAEALRGELQGQIEGAAQQARQLHGQATSALAGAVSALEARIADLQAGLAQELRGLQEAVSRGDSSRIHLRRALQAEGAQTRSSAAELSRASAHALDSMEARWRGEVAELRAVVAELGAGLSRESTELRAGLAERATQGEVSGAAAAAAERCGHVAEALDGQRTQLRAAEAGLAGRCAELRQEAQSVRAEAQGSLAALAGELAELRAATASLASGVVGALRVIGLWEPSAAPGGAARAREGPPGPAGGAAAPQAGRAPQPQPPQERVGVDDLLLWERSGRSLAAHVALRWQQREAAAAPTLLAALEQRLEVEEHAVAKELIRSASRASEPPGQEPARVLPLLRAPATAAPLALPAAGKAPPSGLSQLRQQRIGLSPAST